jgi:hypothetical protein
MSGTLLIDLVWSIPSLVRLTLERITYANNFFPTLSRAKRLSENRRKFLPALSSHKLAVSFCIDIWRLLLNIWDLKESSEACPEDDNWAGHEPLRRNLQVSLWVASVNEITHVDELMDRFSLRRIFLWNRYKILPSIKLVGHFTLTDTRRQGLRQGQIVHS